MENQVLLRTRRRIVAGVCGGLARRFGIDPLWMRIIYIFISIISAAFPGVLVYLFLWIIMPSE
ncbi:MAG: PspC domain-containing protein [Bacteroidota bacterium]|nr:PspC domain-containing protein [Bacteroidota bacterium]